MKRIALLLLCAMLLCGCTGNGQLPDETVQAVIPTEPEGCYWADSPVERMTDGAVRAYPLQIPDVYAIAAAGEDVIVFSGNSTTTLTRLTGNHLFRVAQTRLGTFVSADAGVLCTAEDGLIYYDESAGEVVFLDDIFRPYRRVPIPDSAAGMPVLSADRENLYYCSEDGIRVLNMSTGISRLLRQTTDQEIVLETLIVGDSILKYSLRGQPDWYDVYIDTATGEQIEQTNETCFLRSGSGYFYIDAWNDGVRELIFGDEDGALMTLYPQDILEGSYFSEYISNTGKVLLTRSKEENWILDVYDLKTGLHPYSMVVPELNWPYSFIQSDSQSSIYFLSSSMAESVTLYRWDLSLSATADTDIYTGPHYTLEHPDEMGLEICRAYAAEIGERYGIRVQVGPEAADAEPWDYHLVPEYQVPAIHSALQQLDEVLSAFPEDFFPMALESLGDSRLNVHLVRRIQGIADTGALDELDGVQYWLEGDPCIALTVNDRVLQTVYHELFHVLESRLLSRSDILYRWDELNPEGFAYDNDYRANQQRDDWMYLEEDTTRAFIDFYSMSFAHEDRARIMEYACVKGNEHYFLSEIMQRKLLAICTAIREAYDLQDSPRHFLWEQYLDVPHSE